MLWTEYSTTDSISAVGAEVLTELYQNAVTDEKDQGGDVVIVDGLICIHSNTDDLMGVRLIVAHGGLVSADLDLSSLLRREDLIFYNWHTARGPSYFRLRSKKAIAPQYKLWSHTYKLRGTSATQINVGYQLATVYKH